MVSSPTRLSRKIHFSIFVLILEESSRHASPARQLAIALVQTSFQLPPRSQIQVIVIALVVDVRARICVVFLASFVVALEVAGEQVDSVLVLGHLVCVIDVADQFVLGVVEDVVFVVER